MRFLLLLAALPLLAAELRVMTFNVRYPNPADGPDIWDNRRDLLVETIREATPDVMGTQELFYLQGQYIAEKLPEYAWFGLSRRGNKEDEHMGVFYKKSRLRVEDSGNFWLSETPNVPGSSSWNMSLPRMVTWAVFTDLQTQRRFTYYNTHFAHRGQQDEPARIESAKLIATRIGLAAPFILTGDFNAPPTSEAYRVLTATLTDSKTAAAASSGPEGTFHGFKGTVGPARIDWILFRAPQWKVKRVDALTKNRAGRYPSDHLPVLAIFDTGTEPEFDLLLKGGTVIDPKNRLNTLRDVAITGKTIAAVASNIPREKAKRVVDVSGLYVVPGLIDMHTHVYTGSNGPVLAGGDSSVPADMHSFRAGVTTVVDAGSSGWKNFPDFRDRLIRPAHTRILAFLNIAGGGMGPANEQDQQDYDPSAAAQMIEANRDLIVGIKTAHWAAPDWTAVDRAVKAADLAKVPLMVDFGIIHIERPHRDLFLDKLRPGDIYTHMYRPFDPVLDADGKLRPYYRNARERGILFDVGHGSGSLLFKWAVPAMRQGFAPDTISTDLHVSSANGGMKTMLGTMSKFLNLNMPLPDVIRASTWAPAQAIHRPALGHLTVGSEADVAVLRLEKGQFGFLDVGGSKMVGTQQLSSELTLCAGKIVWDQNGIAADPWEKQTAETFEYKPGLSLTMLGRSAVPRPAVLWIHGGGWTGGRPEMFLPAVEYTASQGVVGFTLQYRLGSVGPAVEDVEAALIWIRRHSTELGVDPQRIIAAGDSAGGHLALALGTVTRERANAIVAFNPIPDLTGKWANRTTSPAQARLLSPLFHIDAQTPPVLILHGQKDTVVPYQEAERFRAAHSKTKLILYPDSQHAFVVPGYTATPQEVDRAMNDAFNWLRESALLPRQH